MTECAVYCDSVDLATAEIYSKCEGIPQYRGNLGHLIRVYEQEAFRYLRYCDSYMTSDVFVPSEFMQNLNRQFSKIFALMITSNFCMECDQFLSSCIQMGDKQAPQDFGILLKQNNGKGGIINPLHPDNAECPMSTLLEKTLRAPIIYEETGLLDYFGCDMRDRKSQFCRFRDTLGGSHSEIHQKAESMIHKANMSEWLSDFIWSMLWTLFVGHTACHMVAVLKSRKIFDSYFNELDGNIQSSAKSMETARRYMNSINIPETQLVDMINTNHDFPEIPELRELLYRRYQQSLIKGQNHLYGNSNSNMPETLGDPDKMCFDKNNSGTGINIYYHVTPLKTQERFDALKDPYA